MSNTLLKSKNAAQMSSPESSSLCQLSVAVSKAPCSGGFTTGKAPLLGRERMEFFSGQPVGFSHAFPEVCSTQRAVRLGGSFLDWTCCVILEW